MSVVYLITKKPIKYLAIGVSLLGIGACSYKGGDKYADLYQDVPTEGALDTPYANEEENLNPYFSETDDGALSEEAPILAKTSQKPKNKKIVRDTVQPGEEDEVAYRRSRFPKIAASPIQTNDYLLNGYLFVRGETNWKQISKLVYGREDRAQLLAEWNAGQELKTGNVLYYNSPFRPEDSSALKLFEDDFGLSLEGLTVQDGDSLSLIALRTYGSLDGWHEVASLNKDLLANPDQIEIGQVIRISPNLRNNQPVLQAAVDKIRAQAEAIVEDSLPAATALDTAASDEAFLEAESSQAPPIEAAVDEMPAQETIQEPVVEEASSELIPTDDIIFLLGALLCLAVIVVLVVRRRRAAALKPSEYVRVVNDRNGTDG